MQLGLKLRNYQVRAILSYLDKNNFEYDLRKVPYVDVPYLYIEDSQSDVYITNAAELDNYPENHLFLVSYLIADHDCDWVDLSPYIPDTELSIQEIIRALTTDQLKQAYGEHDELLRTGVLPEGIVRTTAEQIKKVTGQEYRDWTDEVANLMAKEAWRRFCS